MNCLLVGIGGFIGSVLRYLVGLIPIKEVTTFPIKTFSINVIGCIIISVISVWAMRDSDVNPKLILMLKTGVCGGFTTFSTFSLETSTLLGHGNYFTAFLYVVLSITIGIGTIFLIGNAIH